jgi:hypothetical protein
MTTGSPGFVRPPNNHVNGQGILLASVEFTAEEVGMTGFSGSCTFNEEHDGFWLSNDQMAQVEFDDDGLIEIIPIPLPAPMLLAAAGLAGVAVLRRKLI